MSKRVRAFGLAVAFGLSVIFPVRQAQAVPLVGLAVAALSSGGAVVSADLLTAGVTSLIGGTIMAISLMPGDANAPVRVPLASDTAVIDAVMPPPSAPSTSPPVVTGGLPADANTIQAAWCFAATQYEAGSCGSVTSLSSCMSSFQGGFAGRYCGVVGGALDGTKYGDNCAGCTGTQQSSSCGAGYAASGSDCVLMNPRLAVADNKVDLSRAAGGYSSAGDADKLPSYASVSGGKLYAQGVNSRGQTVMIEYAVSADGTKTYVTHYTQSEDSTQTTVTTQSIVIDAATGVVSSAGVGTATGSISPSTSAGSTPSVSTGSAVTTGSSSSPLVLPTDYARVGEAAQAAGLITPKLDTLHKDLTDVGALPVDPVAPDRAAFNDSFFSGTFGSLLSWRLPSHTSTCPVATFDYTLFGAHQHIVMDAQCSISEQVRPVLNVVMVTFWLITALFILLGA